MGGLSYEVRRIPCYTDSSGIGMVKARLLASIIDLWHCIGLLALLTSFILGIGKELPHEGASKSSQPTVLEALYTLGFRV